MRSEVPSLHDLTSRFLEQQTQSRELGIVEAPGFEVEPHEAFSGPNIEPKTAWQLALFSLEALDDERNPCRLAAVPGWNQFILARPPLHGVPMCSGNFPQLVRDLTGLLRSPQATDSCASPLEFQDRPSLFAWAERMVRDKRFPEALVAVGVLRLAADYDKADDYLVTLADQVPNRWRAALENERAALAWHRGETTRAIHLWNQLPDRLPIRFNRGVYHLFHGQPDEARRQFRQVIDGLPEDNAWHQLAELYSAVARLQS